MQKAATTTETPEGFTDAEWEKFETFQIEKERRRIAAERFKAGLSTERLLLRNETGNPLSLPFRCTFDAHDLATDLRCDGSDPACRLRATKPLAAPGELFIVPAGHRKATPNLAAFEVAPTSAADEPTAQDRLVLGELRSVKQGAERPANQAARTLADLEAQERILAERKLQQQAEADRRLAHVKAAQEKVEEFLRSRSEAWREALLAGKAEASLNAAKRTADEAERRRPEVHTVADLRRAEAGDPGPAAHTIGPGGQPVRLKVGRS